MTRRLLWRRHLPQGGLRKSPYKGDAGIDLVVAEYVRIYSNSREPTKINIGIQIALPEDVAALVIGRSSTHLSGLIIANTLIDPGFRGDIYVLAYMIYPYPGFWTDVNPGDRVAQLLPVPCLGDGLIVEEVFGQDLPPSERGARGWGSTGS